jgi:hypothetical protein
MPTNSRLVNLRRKLAAISDAAREHRENLRKGCNGNDPIELIGTVLDRRLIHGFSRQTAKGMQPNPSPVVATIYERLEPYAPINGKSRKRLAPGERLRINQHSGLKARRKYLRWLERG